MHDEQVQGFSPEQRDEGYPVGVEKHAWHRARNRILFRKLSERSRRGIVLDVGCGPGITVAHLRDRGVDCYGCDLARYEPIEERLASHLFFERDARALPAELREKVGTLMLLDVLEHLPEPQSFLHGCLAAFPALDQLLVALPARMELWSQYDEYFGHVRRFDRGSVEELFGSDSMEIEEVGYFFHFLYPMLRMTRRTAGGEMPPPRRPWLHDWLGVLFDWEERVLPASWPGTSILARVGVSRNR